MAQATLSCRIAAIHLAAALSDSPVDCRNRRGFSAEKRIYPSFPYRTFSHCKHLTNKCLCTIILATE